MDEIETGVLRRLKSYPAMKRKLEQLRYELENSVTVDETDIIESLVLGAHNEGQLRCKNAHLSDKTMAIAMQYKDIRKHMENESICDIRRELRTLEAEVNRLEYYVSLLDKRGATVIRLLYFERRSWEEAGDEMRVSERTLSRYRKSAINELVSMFSLIDGAKAIENT